MIKSMGKIFFVSTLLFKASFAYALEWYVGFGAGTASYDVPDDSGELRGLINEANSFPGINASFNTEDTDTAVKIFGGFNINPYLGIEFGYANLGEISTDFLLTSDGTFSPAGTAAISSSTSVHGLSAAAIGGLPLSDLISVNARAGIYLWDAKFKGNAQDTTGFFFNESFSESDDGNDIYYGIGLDIGWFSLFYEVYDIDGDDVDLTGLSVKYRFN